MHLFCSNTWNNGMSHYQDKIIHFTLIYQNEQYPVQVARRQYYSLMGLISDHLDILGFGLCSGMGSCGTCMVTIGKGHSTLSCDIPVDDALANTIVEVQERHY